MTRRLPLLTISAALIAATTMTGSQIATALDQRIERIQNLLPPVVVKDEPPQTVKLMDRMTQLGVPGVSVAVIHEGKIEWARGFGVTQTGGSSVTPETLFQAGSISKPLT